jgi:hypothetical protein
MALSGDGGSTPAEETPSRAPTPSRSRSGAPHEPAVSPPRRAADVPLPSLPRRRFLRGLSGAATVFGAPLWLTACGGGGAAPDPSADPASDPAAPSTPDTPDAPGTPGAPGDGSGDPSSPAPQPEAMDTTIRSAALRAVEQACRSLAHQQPSLPPLAFVEQVAAGMRTLAAYAEVGVDAATLTAWGVFSDGRVHLVSNAPHPQRRPAGAVG